MDTVVLLVVIVLVVGVGTWAASRYARNDAKSSVHDDLRRADEAEAGDPYDPEVAARKAFDVLNRFPRR